MGGKCGKKKCKIVTSCESYWPIVCHALYSIGGLVTLSQAWAIPGFGQKYYTQYYTGQKYAKLYNTLCYANTILNQNKRFQALNST